MRSFSAADGGGGVDSVWQSRYFIPGMTGGDIWILTRINTLCAWLFHLRNIYLYQFDFNQLSLILTVSPNVMFNFAHWRHLIDSKSHKKKKKKRKH